MKEIIAIKIKQINCKTIGLDLCNKKFLLPYQLCLKQTKTHKKIWFKCKKKEKTKLNVNRLKDSYIECDQQ